MLGLSAMCRESRSHVLSHSSVTASLQDPSRLFSMIGLNCALTDDGWVIYGFVGVKEGLRDGDRRRDELRRRLPWPGNEREIRKSPIRPPHPPPPLSVMSHTCTLL